MPFVAAHAFRVLSCPFVVQILPRLHRFVYFVSFVATPAFDHSWFLLSPLLFFVYFVVFVVNPCHSCPFVVPTLPPCFLFVPFVVFVVNPCLWSFVSIRVHSWFLLSLLHSLFVYFVFFVVNPCLCPFVSIRVHSWFLLSPFSSSICLQNCVKCAIFDAV